jgi:hypothetical protein
VEADWVSVLPSALVSVGAELESASVSALALALALAFLQAP